MMSRKGWLLFATMGLIWGIPYLLIKVAVGGLHPATLVFFRTALAALLLLPLAAARGQLRPLLRRWRPLLAFAAIEVAVPWLLLNTAETRLSSSLSGLLIAAVPLVGAILGWATGGERLGPVRLAGLLVGLVGVAALVGLDLHVGDVWAVLEIIGVAIGYAQEVRFSHDGRPFLFYESRAWLLTDDGTPIRPAFRETGFWRAVPRDGQPSDEIEVLLTNPAGIMELYLGRVVDLRVELVTDAVVRTVTAKEVNAAQRLYGIVDGALLYAHEMAAVGQPMSPHLSAKLNRVAG
ncbi:MAG: hypothetical protein AUG44_13745 [Actinobacteria bacterium 13_1_20CM_3_71_11]|nr:MAG: hypothetical protein AUG44_13745 [Actinobacteria bacterium 13_1_20CM_3_71_11]